MKEKLTGIYSINNLINNKKYIGQSTDINARWYNHKYCLNNNRHSNDCLQKAWNKYGEKNFEFTILEICSEEKLDEREQFYIKELNTLCRGNGYNLDSGGNLHKSHSIETREKMSRSARGRTCSEETKKKISQNRKGEMCGSKHFAYGKKLSNEQKEKISQKLKLRTGDKCYQACSVICINTGEIFTTIKEAASKYKQYGVQETNISKCCKNQRRYCGRFDDNTPIQWSYYEHNQKYELKENVDSYVGNSKPVSQYDLNMHHINTYESAKDAERQTGINAKLISRVCRGERFSTHGYHFKFAA